jgi:hypothetical protein
MIKANTAISKKSKRILTWIEEDLLADICEMSDDKESYLNQDKTFNYIASVKPNQTLSVDSLDKYRTSCIIQPGCNKITEGLKDLRHLVKSGLLKMKNFRII